MSKLYSLRKASVSARFTFLAQSMFSVAIFIFNALYFQ